MKAVIETFRPVMGYEGLYEVSDYGAVRSLNYQGKKRIKYLMNVKRPTGYECIDLSREGKRKTFRIHRLVWEAFVGKIPDGMEIDHVNAIRDDNRLDNLRVVTHKGNQANPISVENHRDSMRRMSQDPKWLEATRKSHNKPILQIDKTTGEVIRKWECARDVERELGINYQNISACCLGKQNTARGFKWRFA